MTFPLTKGRQTFTDELRLLHGPARTNGCSGDGCTSRTRARSARTRLAASRRNSPVYKEPLADFLGQAFGGTRLDPAPFLPWRLHHLRDAGGDPNRSADRHVAHGPFGIDQKAPLRPRPVAGRSCFLKRMLGEVILGESLARLHGVQNWIRGGAVALLRIASFRQSRGRGRLRYRSGSGVRRQATGLAVEAGRRSDRRLSPAWPRQISIPYRMTTCPHRAAARCRAGAAA